MVARFFQHLFVLYSVSFASRFYLEFVLDSSGFEAFSWWQPYRGYISDLAICVAISALLSLIKLRFITYFIYCFWAVASAGNLVHVLVNYSNLDFYQVHFLGEAEFVSGSVFSADFALAVLALLSLAALITILAQQKIWRTLSIVKWPAILLFASIFPAIVMQPAYNENWRQYHVIEENIRDMVVATTVLVPPSNKAHAAKLYNKITAHDVSGVPLVSFPENKPNILIIIVERLSDWYVQSGNMPYLQSLSKKSLYYPNFIYPQQFTYNGLYSILCGDYPALVDHSVKKLERNKWFATVFKGPAKPCLPALLRPHGYQSEFFQGSQLSFTFKGSFMKKIGMDRSHSAMMLSANHHDIQLQHTYLGWGMSDEEFFKLTAENLIELNKKPRPWFATMMTTGTHHPYHVNRKYASRFASRTDAAFHAADEAVRDMMERLEKAGVLNNTLVLIMGDEAHIRKNRAGELSKLGNSWGVLLVKTPENDVKQIDDYFTQADIQASILDYIGIDSPHARHRSVFREYSRFRPMLFASPYAKYWAALPQKGRMIQCKGNYTDCSSYFYTRTIFDKKPVKISPLAQTDLYISVSQTIDRAVQKGAPRLRLHAVKRSGVRKVKVDKKKVHKKKRKMHRFSVKKRKPADENGLENVTR